MTPIPEFGVYVHVPFCLRRCDYCAFATWDDRGHLVAQYVDALATELAGTQLRRPATSVFFGGGTPSLLTPDQMATILDRIDRVDGAEVSVECNPDTVDHDKLGGYLDAGVTRISLGVQSMVPLVLGSLGRTHDPANVVAAVDAIRSAGFGTWNIDVIYGAVGELRDDWRRTLEGVI